uniref:Uncharacterized protein n=1 Tax=Heterorhabditis bacteriophora TaxID=37862 RepID=A0A1I7WBQ3_HETBA
MLIPQKMLKRHHCSFIPLSPGKNFEV